MTEHTAAGGIIVDGRTLCSVVACRRSRKGRWSWWICPDHWRPVPMWAKRRKTKMIRALRRRGEMESNERSWWCTTERGNRVADAMGRFLIRVANNRAAGL
jgi:hypothetical protein